MKSLFDDLYLFEIILLFLGIFLFLILCAGLTYYIVKKANIKKLLMFFPIPIIMIAYPSIKEIQIGDYKIALRQYEGRLLDNPEDKEAKEKLQKVTKILEKRASSSEDLKAVSVANLLLGNSDKVIDLTNKAIEKESVSSNKNTHSDSEVKTDIEAHEDQKIEKPSLRNFTEIKKLATLQSSLKNDSTSLKDSVLFKEQIQKIQWDNPKTKDYLNKKIIPKKNKDDRIKKFSCRQ